MSQSPQRELLPIVYDAIFEALSLIDNLDVLAFYEQKWQSGQSYKCFFTLNQWQNRKEMDSWNGQVAAGRIHYFCGASNPIEAIKEGQRLGFDIDSALGGLRDEVEYPSWQFHFVGPCQIIPTSFVQRGGDVAINRMSVEGFRDFAVWLDFPRELRNGPHLPNPD